MREIKDIATMQKWSKDQKGNNKTIGLVPTMGYLHEGHLALVKAAKKNCDKVIVSIFVNPMQFGQGEDFAEYPRDLSRDYALLQKEAVDAVFVPTAAEMYPLGYNTFVEVSGEITNKLCGASRPGHFKGVTTVVSKLFNICLPDVAYFGQKDVQQVIIIEKMVEELNFPLKIERVPIVREEDGLAKSSRNVYLDPEKRQEALVLNEALQLAKGLIENGERDTKTLKGQMTNLINRKEGALIDYIELVDSKDLSEVLLIKERVLIAIAVKFGSTRLIDNLLVEV